MEPFRDDNELIAELRALRPAPRPAFAAELDERAAAGFPRRSTPASAALTNLFARLRATPPRRLALAGGSLALAMIAVATALVVASDTPRTNTSGTLARLSPSERLSASPEAQAPPRVRNLARGTAEPRSSSKGSSGSSGIQYESVPPATTGHTAKLRPFSREVPSSVTRANGGSTESSPSLDNRNSSYDNSGPYVVKAPHRDVERSAEMVLGTDPSGVADDAAEVFDAVHAVDGIVLSSSVTGGAVGDAGARFDLLIPAAKLGDALAAFSSIDTVVSRHEATDDITAPTVTVGEQLRDSRATIDGLLVQLAGADSDEERAEVEVELRAERGHATTLRSQAAKLNRRANLSRVSLRIETGNGSATGGTSGGWGLGDALHDAGHILAIAAGVTIVALAILGPLALIALLIWLANRARIRRGRERALA
jgi:Domain of unknown function (DUF4349)